MKTFVSALFFLLLVSPTLAGANIIIEMEKPLSTADSIAAAEIKESDINQTVIELSNTIFPFKQTLTIRYNETEGPYYDPENHTVFIPYQFYIESKHYFENNGYEENYGKSATNGAIDTLLHTLLHEAGHAYIADQGIPILGKEEDAVDNFATILLLNYIDEGDAVAISAADMFAFESESPDRPDYYEMTDYAGEHSFDLQRYFATLCLVYGSNPEKHQSLLDEIESDYLDDRQEYCLFNFEQINNNWHGYLVSAQ